MSALTSARQLVDAIGQAIKSSKFCVASELTAVDPGLEVDGLGAITLPLKRGIAKKLVARCRVAPYGKGTATLVNPKVRKTYELNPKEFQLGEAWKLAVDEAARIAAAQLGLPADQVKARLYKLLVYEKGGFFLRHRDSEKHDGMVASLIVVLPNPFEQGALVVRHGGKEEVLKLERAAKGEGACYAAFYADCEHEVKQVSNGVRFCLAYNLVLRPKRTSQVAAQRPAAAVDALTQSILSWTERQPAQPLVFALEHQYTERGLTPELLKGVDRELADLIVTAAEKAECLVHLAQVSRHLSQFADDGSLERSYYRRYRPRRAIEIGETYEDDFQAEECFDLAGKKQPFGPIALERTAVVASIPIDDWKPTAEEFEGYTGNAGNTLDRWYHRSAILVWHRDHHFDVVAKCGAEVSVPLLKSLVTKLAKTPKNRRAEARADCIRFARAIISRWPRQYRGYGHVEREQTMPQRAFPGLLLKLNDRDSIAMFLGRAAETDETLRLNAFIVSACREFGWNTFDRELTQLMAEQPVEKPRYAVAYDRPEIPPRDLEWLADFCLEIPPDPQHANLAGRLCAKAVERFCLPFPIRRSDWSDERETKPSVSESSLPLLLKALVEYGRDEELSRVIHFVECLPKEFRIDVCQVPALKTLIPWSRKEFGKVPQPLLAWLASVRQTLQAATATPPAPPADWARPAEVGCNCKSCAQLNAFLADPANGVGRFPAREDLRSHLVSMIQRHGCDVKHTVERVGSPFSLVLTKTNGSIERAARRFKANCRLLEILNEVSDAVAI